MNKIVTNIYALYEPSDVRARIPLVLDSPHSGTIYPVNSGIVAPRDALRTTCDSFVDELWMAAPDIGASLLAARFPRAYIDPNREKTDIDPDLLAEPWPEPIVPTERSQRGMGLIRRLALPGIPMYSAPLSVAELMQRIDGYYTPYHETLSDLIDAARRTHGQAWHINCHSMKSKGNVMNVDAGKSRPDIVVSDRRGTTCDPEFTHWVASRFSEMGYAVSINSPYQGAHIVQKHGLPGEGRHSLQIEINRRLYMDEKTFEKSDRFDDLQLDLQLFLAETARYLKHKLAATSLHERAAS